MIDIREEILSERETLILDPLPKSLRECNELRTFDQMVERIVGHVEEAGLEGRPVVVGQSAGGLMAMLVAAKLREKCAGVVLYGATQLGLVESLARPIKSLRREPARTSFGLWIGAAACVPVHDGLRSSVLSTAAGRALSLWPYLHNPRAAEPLRLVRSLNGSGGIRSATLLRALRGVDIRAVLAGLPQIDAFIVRGEEDRFVTDEDLEYWRSKVNLVGESVVPAAGHWAHHDDRSRTLTLLARAVDALQHQG